MKKILLISGLFFVFSCKNETDKRISENTALSDSLSSEVKDTLFADKDLTSVETIKEEYDRLNAKLKSKQLDSVGFNYDCNNERSGNVVFYSEKGELKIVKHSYAEYSHFSSTENYFIKNGDPFFIFKDEISWSFDGGSPEKPETKDDIKEKRFYIVNNKAIKCLEKEYTLKSNSANNPKPENIQNKENQNCSVEELQKTFKLLLKNKDKRGAIKCL